MNQKNTKKTIEYKRKRRTLKDLGEEAITSIVTTILCEIGVPADILGYKYIHEAILMTADDAGFIKDTGNLYSSLARKYQTTPSEVESTMSRAIGFTWDRRRDINSRDTFDYFFNKCEIKPTGHEFVKLIADRLVQVFS